MVTLASRARPGTKVLFRDLEGEAVLLQLDSGHYYSLNEVGTRIWSLLLGDGRLETTFRTLLGEYEVEEGRLLAEFLSFVDTLASRGLLELHET